MPTRGNNRDAVDLPRGAATACGESGSIIRRTPMSLGPPGSRLDPGNALTPAWSGVRVTRTAGSLWMRDDVAT